MRKPEQPPAIESMFAKPGFFDTLAKTMADPKFQGVARRIESDYRHWHRIRYMANAEGLPAEALWVAAKMSRMPSYRPLPLRGEGGAKLKYNMPDGLQEELMHVDQQLAGRLLSPDEQPISTAHQERFIISSLREEAIASSMLEGAATTRRDAKEMLASGRKPRTHGERMVANNYSAITFIRENRQLPLTPELLLRVQSILTEGTIAADEVGRFRNDKDDDIRVVDVFGEVLHRPPPASELQERLTELCAFANEGKDGAFIHPVIRASVLHFQIGFDHPFCDGNGRTARAIFYWSMLKSGYWLFEWIPISPLIHAGPSKYQLAFQYTETDNFDVTYFLAYKAKIIRRARKAMGEYIARKQNEMAEARKVFEADSRLNNRQRDVILRMLRAPYLATTIQEHLSRHHTAYGTARSDLLDLVEWGYLSKRQIGNRFEFVSGTRLGYGEKVLSAKATETSPLFGPSDIVGPGI